MPSHRCQAEILLRSGWCKTDYNKQCAEGRKIWAEKRKMRNVANLASIFRFRCGIVMMPERDGSPGQKNEDGQTGDNSPVEVDFKMASRTHFYPLLQTRSLV